MNTLGSLDTLSIPVSWSMSHPSLEARKWHCFREPDEVLATSPEHTATEELFAWPKGTIAALEQAFDLHLSRSSGWQLDAIKDPRPWIQAAQIFRRGAPYSGQTRAFSSGSYAIHFKPDTQPAQPGKDDGPFIIDHNVASLWNLNPRPSDLILKLDEASKSLATAALIKNWITNHPGTVTIVGGGILSDVAAFSAALISRPFRLIPTTLLAMVDACVGGKTGVNFGKYGKNQLGLFAFPLEVTIAPAWLTTLSRREFFAGVAEGYKHAVIKGDSNLAAALSRLPHSIPAITPHLATLVHVKAKIISQDSSETGIRAVLNFGHTLAHALEKVSQTYAADDPLLHGEAIGIGMLFALSLSHHLGFLKKEVMTTIADQIKRSTFLLQPAAFRKHLGLKMIPDGTLIDRLAEGVLQDKKNQESGYSEWVLLRDWGEFASRDGTFTAPVANQVFRDHARTFFSSSGLFTPIDAAKL